MPFMHSMTVKEWGMYAIAHVLNVEGCTLSWPDGEVHNVAASLGCTRCNMWFSLDLRVWDQHDDELTAWVQTKLAYTGSLTPRQTKQGEYPGRVELLEILNDQIGKGGLLPGETPWSENARGAWDLRKRASQPTAWEHLLSNL